MSINNSAGSGTNEVMLGELFRHAKIGRLQMFVGLTLFFAFSIDAWEVMVPSFILMPLMKYFHIGYAIAGLLLSAPFYGTLIGAYAIAWIADVYGRKRAIQVGIIGYSIAGVLSALAPPNNYWWYFWSRLVAGIFMMPVMAQPFPYLEEFLPIHSRGRAATYLASGWPIGTLMAVGAAYLEPWIHWQGVLLISAAAMAIWMIPVSLIPESPYYLVAVGRESEAKKVLRRALGEELYEKLKVDSLKLRVEERRRGSILELFRRDLVKYTLLILFINIFYSFTYYGVFTWIAAILQSKGLTFIGTLEYVVIAALAQFPAYFLTARLAETRLGRKITTVSFMVLTGIFAYLFAISSNLTMLLISLVLMSFVNLGSWGVKDAWEPEIYPTPLRGVLEGWVVSGQRISASISPVIIGFLLSVHGITFTTVVTAVAFSAWISAVLASFLPETRGKILR